MSVADLSRSRPRRLTAARSAAVILAAILLVTAAVPVGRAGLARWQASAAPPNVLLIVADDLRFDTTWGMPTLTQLAERGVSFTRAFVTTPLCCPSRATILTGQYARQHGVRDNEPPLGGVQAFDDRSTLATWLQRAGVRTALIGRYLNGYRSRAIPPGWDYWFALLQQGDDNGQYFRYYVNNNGEDEFHGSGSDRYSTRVLGRRALQFLREGTDRPFMLMLTPRAPHAPATPDPRDAGAFKDAELPALPPSFDEADVGDKPSAVRGLGPLTPVDRERVDGLRRRQLESLLALDRQIGAIVEALRADGRLEQTWIIFTSDNGLSVGEHRLGIGKSCAYEECIRVPLVVVPPGGLAGPRVDDRLVANIDLAPTIAAIMGVEPDRPTDGRSLVPLIRDQQVAWREALVLEQWRGEIATEGFVAVRTADRKYVRYDTGEEELYDEVGDPHELENVAAMPDWMSERARLVDLLATLTDEIAARPPDSGS